MTVVNAVAADERPAELINAHRAEQAAYRSALAAENAAQAAACTQRLDQIAQAVRTTGHADLAAALAEETNAGAVLLTLLTAADEVSREQLPAALTRFQTSTVAVETCLNGSKSGEHANVFERHPNSLAGRGPGAR